MAEALPDSPLKRVQTTSPDQTDSPKRAGASNISTSTSSFEAGVQHDPNLNTLAVDMFSKVELYLQGELDAVLSEYGLLTEMNRRIYDKYADMRTVGQETCAAIQQLNNKYIELEPCLRQLEEIDENLAHVEVAVNKLDAYSKQLEARWRSAVSQ